MKINTPGPENSRNQLAVLHDILQRIARAEHPADFAIVKQLLLERISDLEEELAPMPMAASRP